MKRSVGLAVALILSGWRPASATAVHYEGYVAGFNVAEVDADFDITAEQYHVRLDYKTVGALAVMVRSTANSTADGRFMDGRPVPHRFFTTGSLGSEGRVTQIDYRDGQPLVRQMQPPNDKEREPVPPDRQRDTVDTLSAMAELIRRVNATGRCEGRVLTFDGRRLSLLEGRTEGEQVLESVARSSFAGPATRCTFTGRQLGGFWLDADRAELSRPQEGTAWFAALAPGGPKVPVRMAFHTRWIGDATVYVTGR